MFFSPVVVDAIETTLEYSPNAFYTISMSHAVYKFLGGMPYALMLVFTTILIAKVNISTIFIGV